MSSHAPHDLLDRTQVAGILLINKVELDRATMAQLPALRYIGVLATGYKQMGLFPEDRAPPPEVSNPVQIRLSQSMFFSAACAMPRSIPAKMSRCKGQTRYQ